MRGSLRVAMVAACPLPYPRGTPVRIFKLAEALARRGHEVHVVTYHLGQKVERTPVILHRIPEVRTYRKCSPGPSCQKLLLLDPLLARELVRVLRTYPIDVIHAHHYEGLLVSAWVRRRTNHALVYDAHTLLESELPAYRLGLPRAITLRTGRLLDRWLPRLADHVIAVSEGIRRKLVCEVGLVPDDVTVAANGVEHDHFDRPGAAPPSRPNGVRALIFTGTLAPYQRIDLMLRAFRELLRGRRDIRLLIVSDSSFREYEPLAKRLGVREHIDLVRSSFDDVPAFLASADVALNPRTICDGLPQKLLNYMAAGKPIVSFAGSARILEHGVTGLVIENDDIVGFADAVRRLLDDAALSRALGAGARRQAAAEFTWEKTAERAEEVYTRVLKRRAG